MNKPNKARFANGKWFFSLEREFHWAMKFVQLGHDLTCAFPLSGMNWAGMIASVSMESPKRWTFPRITFVVGLSVTQGTRLGVQVSTNWLSSESNEPNWPNTTLFMIVASEVLISTSCSEGSTNSQGWWIKEFITHSECHCQTHSTSVHRQICISLLVDMRKVFWWICDFHGETWGCNDLARQE